MWLSGDADVGNDDNDLIAFITPELRHFILRVIRSAANTTLCGALMKLPASLIYTHLHLFSMPCHLRCIHGISIYSIATLAIVWIDIKEKQKQVWG